MTSLLSKKPDKRLGLVVDLDICVGCHACVVSCQEWNTKDQTVSTSSTGSDAHNVSARGAWLNRVLSFEAVDGDQGRTVHFPKACLHCDNAVCVTVCPTGASYKRAEDGIVLVDEDRCIGCGLCAWACPYGAREMDETEGVIKKCTLCIDRIYNTTLSPAEQEPVCVSTCPAKARHFGDFNDQESAVSRLVVERFGYDLMPEMGYRPTSKYLPPRKPEPEEVGDQEERETPRALALEPRAEGGFLGWLDQVLSDMP